jgi:hypothetical protein
LLLAKQKLLAIAATGSIDPLRVEMNGTGSKLLTNHRVTINRHENRKLGFPDNFLNLSQSLRANYAKDFGCV